MIPDEKSNLIQFTPKYAVVANNKLIYCGINGNDALKEYNAFPSNKMFYIDGQLHFCSAHVQIDIVE